MPNFLSPENCLSIANVPHFLQIRRSEKQLVTINLYYFIDFKTLILPFLTRNDTSIIYEFFTAKHAKFQSSRHHLDEALFPVLICIEQLLDSMGKLWRIFFIRNNL